MDRPRFWNEVFTLKGSVTPCIKWRMMVFFCIAAAIATAGTYTQYFPTTDIAPYELVGAALAVLLMLRTNSGYDRWYEGRKLWGGIVNQCRNLAQIGIVYGPKEQGWREDFITWVSAFPHACRHSLRGETELEDMDEVIGHQERLKLSAAEHFPLYVSNRIARLLQEALDSGQLDRFAFMQAEHQRNLLIDHIGACERILKTPLASALSVKIRRFLFLYLVALPFGIFDKVGFATPFIVMMVAYPLLSLDQISVELQNPFSKHRLSHLPLGDICGTIQSNLHAMLDNEPGDVDEATSNLQTKPAKLAVMS